MMTWSILLMKMFVGTDSSQFLFSYSLKCQGLFEIIVKKIVLSKFVLPIDCLGCLRRSNKTRLANAFDISHILP
uniref:Uncharacterized protein n=1 Tax=Arion vulgaris TaxID=1028688 RepID=A0A0B6ZNY9_9EUPU